MTRVRKILAPADFSDLSTVGIRYALEMARDIGAEVIVYHAIDVGEHWTNSPTKISPYRDLLEESLWLLDRFLAVNFAGSFYLFEVRKAVEFSKPHKNTAQERG